MYFIDVQGTLIDDTYRRPLPGAAEWLAALNAEKIPYLVVTNNTKAASGDFLAYLNRIGFSIPPQRYLDALMMVERVVPRSAGIAVYGSEAFRTQLQALGYTLDYDTPGALLVSVRSDYDSETFAQMIELLSRGAVLYGMHETTLYVHEGKRYPGVGALLKMLSFAASVPYRTVGKPSVPFYHEALRRLRMSVPDAVFSEITMISDDYEGDLRGAAALGMGTALVLSGKVRPDDVLISRLRSEERDVMVYNDISKIRVKAKRDEEA